MLVPDRIRSNRYTRRSENVASSSSEKKRRESLLIAEKCPRPSAIFPRGPQTFANVYPNGKAIRALRSRKILMRLFMSLPGFVDNRLLPAERKKKEETCER